MTSGRRRSRSTSTRSSTTASAAARAATRSASSSRRRRSTSPARSSSWPTRYGIELKREEEDPQAEERRRRRERMLKLLERATVFYERYLWEAAEAEPARRYLAGRGLGDEVLRDFRIGYAPKAWDRVMLAAAAGRLHRAGARGRGSRPPRAAGRLRRPLPRADHVPARRCARARARLRRARDARRPAAEVHEHAGGRALPQAPPALRPRPRACRGREGAAGDRGRGLHGRARAARGRRPAARWRSWARR